MMFLNPDKPKATCESSSWMNRDQYTELEQLPNVGPSLAADLRLVGVSHPKELIGRDPYLMYEDLCRMTRHRHDPCVLDVFISAVRFMQGGPKRPWWTYTPERKHRLSGKDSIDPAKRNSHGGAGEGRLG